MKDNRIKGIIALLVVTVVSFGIIFASKSLVNNEGDSNNDSNTAGGNSEDSLDIADFENIKDAWEIKDDSGNVTGYAVQASARGFAGAVVLQIDFDLDGKVINNLSVVSQNETVGYGSLMEEEDYLSQFPGIVAPVYFEGEAPEGGDEPANEDTGNTSALQDGMYRVESEDFIGGFKFMVVLKVESGAVTSVVWDAMDENGEFKSYLSSVGKYTMVEGNPTWKEQADALAANVLENQSTSGIVMDDEGKTDSVATVSISVNDFVDLVEEALVLAASGEGATGGSTTNLSGGSQIDGISGATASSVAIKEAINRAYEFITDYLSK